jgi:hypothetical protein
VRASRTPGKSAPFVFGVGDQGVEAPAEGGVLAPLH